jgi:hypothetical protein
VAAYQYAERDGHLTRIFSQDDDGNAVLVAQLSLRPGLSAGQMLTLMSNLGPMLYVPPGAAVAETNGHAAPAPKTTTKRGPKPGTRREALTREEVHARRVQIQATLLDAIRAAGDTGADSLQLARALGLDQSRWRSLGRYGMDQLRAQGLVRTTGERTTMRYFPAQPEPEPEP